jgi:hypothetical protein
MAVALEPQLPDEAMALPKPAIRRDRSAKTFDLS